MPDRAKEAEMSAIAQTSAIKLEKTVSLEQIFRKIECGKTRELLDIFDKWPLDEVRGKVTRRLFDWPHQVYLELAGKVEERIRQLHTDYEDDYWRKLLSWYIANSSTDTATTVAVRAIEFAIAFSEEFNEESVVAKDVSGKLKKVPELYWQVPSMRRFIDKLISGLCFGYSERQWIQAERAIRQIVWVHDITYLPQIERLLGSFQNGVYKLCEREGDEFTFGQNLQFLRDAARILKQAQREQTPDLNVVVGSYLRELAGLTGSVIVRLEYQEESDSAKLKVPMDIVVKLELTDPAEASRLTASKLAFFLERRNIRIRWYGEGFTGTKLLNTGKAVEGYIPPAAQFDDQLQCGFSTFPSRGSNRFWLYFLDDKKEFAKVARYLIVE